MEKLIGVDVMKKLNVATEDVEKGMASFNEKFT